MTEAAVNGSVCLSCGSPIGARPFCDRDGAIARSGGFVVGARHRAEELLGAGSHTFVYAGHHLTLGKPVAIKLLRDTDALRGQRFLRDARNAAQLSHDNTISIIDFGRDEALGAAYVAMELFSGQSLDRVLRASGPMPAARAIPVLVQLARSLCNAHMAGVIHRDVTTRNVLVGRDDLVKLSDYGLGRTNDAATSDADIVGFATVAIEMLLGRSASSPLAMIDTLRSDVPRALCQLLERCLATEANVHPRAMELEAELIAIVPSRASAVVLDAPRPRTPTPGPLIPRTRTPTTPGPIARPKSPTPAPIPRLRTPTPSAPVIAAPAPVVAAPVVAAPAIETIAEAPPPPPSEPVAVEAPPKAADKPAEPTLESLTQVGQLIGAHRIVHLLGRGSASAVYLAEHPTSGAKVAIKVIDRPSVAARVVAEARAMSTLDVAAIPHYVEIGTLATRQPYTVMEYFRGEPVSVLVKRDGKQSVARAKEIIAQAATAMVTVHMAGRLHGDLHASNVFLVKADDGATVVKLLDAGIATALARDAVTAGADVSALGTTAFELLAGAPPADGATRLEGVPPRVTETVARMIARELSMAEVVAELDWWTDEPAAASLPTGDPSDAHDSDAISTPAARQWPWLVGGAGAAVLIAVVAIMMFTGGSSSKRTAPEPKAAEPAPHAAPVVVAPKPAPAPEPPPPAPAPAPEVATAPAPTPTPAAAPVPTPTPPTPTPTPAAPAATSPTTTAAAAKPKSTKPAKHRDDAVIVDPFSE
ncbi:MAG TPA: protein kinase [Kofleriaceae bacterium]